MNRPWIRLLYCSFKLEVKLQCKLRQTWVFDLGDLAKLRTVSNVTVRVIELCVIEDVE